ncbi:MAG: hypothetical protein HYR85_03110 [Planctomycetes bacterium]|nr:hypothetical protein [Planctomycetota bacterium]MBI3847643.1 hypothetical protein [Planctomycetota bacterium]
MTMTAIGLVAASLLSTTDPASVLTGVEKTAHFEIRFRPDSRAEASVDRVASLVEGDLEHILKELDLHEFKYTIRLFLYDDVAELQKITGVPSGGHSTTLESHVPHDNDQTRVHELVHVVAEKFTEHGPEPRNLFFAEGLANAVLRFVSGVPVDAVAAFYLKRGELPTLAEIHAIPNFYAWLGQHPGFNGYDVGGSYFRFLLDTYGAAKTRKYYGGVPARQAFGVDLASLEKGWHARLGKVALRPGLQDLLEERAGGRPGALKRSPEATLDDAILGPASEWKSLDGAPIATGDPAKWDGAALVLSGEKNEGDWCFARLGAKPVGDAIVRCEAEPLDSCYGVQIQIGTNCQAMVLRGQGAFLYCESRAVAHDPATSLSIKPVDIVLRRRKGHATVWVDGKLVADADVDGSPAMIGVGCTGGKARIRRIAFRPL